LSKTTSFDVLIIGAGIAGIGCAAMLDRKQSVAILERESECGYHATGRSAAIYIPSYGNHCIRQLTALSHAFFTSAQASSGTSSFLHDRGELVLATAAESDSLSTLLESAETLSEIPIAEARERLPILKPDYATRAAFDASAKDIDVDLLMQHWRKCVTRNNSDNRIIPGQAVKQLRRDEKQWVVDTQDEQFFATTVVNAAGAWADDIAVKAGVQPVGLTPCRRSAVLVPAPGQYTIGRWPAFASVSETWP